MNQANLIDQIFIHRGIQISVALREKNLLEGTDRRKP